MVFNATFNNISVISWQSVLLVEETRVPGLWKTTHLSLITDKLYYKMFYRVHLAIFDIIYQLSPLLECDPTVCFPSKS